MAKVQSQGLICDSSIAVLNQGKKYSLKKESEDEEMKRARSYYLLWNVVSMCGAKGGW